MIEGSYIHMSCSGISLYQCTTYVQYVRSSYKRHFPLLYEDHPSTVYKGHLSIKTTLQDTSL